MDQDVAEGQEAEGSQQGGICVVGRVVESEEQRRVHQSTIDRLVEWSTEWQMLFNAGNCHILHLGPRNARHEYTMGGTTLEAVEHEKDGSAGPPEPEAQFVVYQGC